MSNLDIRLTDIECEMQAIDQTLSNLPATSHADILADRLVRRIEHLQDELIVLYQKHNSRRYKVWQNNKIVLSDKIK